MKGTLRRLLNGGRTFDDALALYNEVLPTRGYAPKTLKQRESELKHIRPEFGGRRLANIEAHHISALVQRLADAGKCVTAQHVLAAVSDILNEALMRGWITCNPALHVRRPKAPVQRHRITLEQWQDILAAGARRLPEWFSPAMKLALVSGQRRSDLVRMRFDHVREGHLFIEQYKTGARIALPLALQLNVAGLSLGAVIDECRKYDPPGPFLLRSAYRRGRALGEQSLSNRFCVAREWAGISVSEGTLPSLHEIRSLAARLYRTQGIDIQTLLGHRRASTTDMYDDARGLGRHEYKRLVI